VHDDRPILPATQRLDRYPRTPSGHKARMRPITAGEVAISTGPYSEAVQVRPHPDRKRESLGCYAAMRSRTTR
jgi:hypothetical protein